MTPLAQDSVSSQANLTITIGVVVWLVALLGWAVHDWVKHHRTQAAVLIGAGALTALVEATATLLMNIHYFPSTNAPIVYSAFGRDIALWVVLMYPAWVGGICYLVSMAVAQGWRGNQLWRLYAAALLFDFSSEIFMVKVGYYSYDGSQPARIFGVPFVWPIVFTSTLMAFALAAQKLLSFPLGVRLLLIPAAPGALLGGVCFLAWPVLLGTGMNLSTPAMSALGVLTAVAALLGTNALVRRLTPASDAAMTISRSGGTASPLPMP